MNLSRKVIFSLLLIAVVTPIVAAAGFSWTDTEGKYLDLLYDGRKVTRYMYAYDTSSPQKIFETYKVLHHAFDETGENFLTNGPEGEKPYQKSIKFPHHRGMYIGWNRLAMDGKNYDTWHMSNGVAQVHQKFLAQKADDKKATSIALIHWKGGDGKILIEETRKTTVHKPAGKTILVFDFETELKAPTADVFLNGDPEHAGFQYRPHNDVATGKSEVKAKYLFPEEGIDLQNGKKKHHLPWVAMSYGLNGKQYSVQHISHPTNPTPDAVYSAYRDYGRFGEFAKHNIPKGKTLTLRYRIWVGKGELPSRIELARRYAAYVAK